MKEYNGSCIKWDTTKMELLNGYSH